MPVVNDTVTDAGRRPALWWPATTIAPDGADMPKSERIDAGPTGAETSLRSVEAVSTVSRPAVPRPFTAT
jgi:hypothetical protein